MTITTAIIISLIKDDAMDFQLKGQNIVKNALY